MIRRSKASAVGLRASVLILIFAMRGTVISATSERPVFTVERGEENYYYSHPPESQLNQRDLAKPLSLNHPVYRRISASGEQMSSSHKRKVIRAAEQEQSLTAFLAKNNAERITEHGFVHEDSASTSDVIRQLSENIDYDEEGFKWPDYASKEDLDLYEGTRGDTGPQAKPTKYHYYPHNQHLYLLPECTTQQVCNLVYTRFNFSQPLCACPDRFQGPCSASISKNDQHTLEVVMKNRKKNDRLKSGPPTLIKTCEETRQIRDCRTPADWAVLALQNIRTGKSQYLVICNCLQGELDGPMNHEQPAYARVPGIRVYGMMCNSRKAHGAASARSWRGDQDDVAKEHPQFPWKTFYSFASSVDWT